jgi:hypothetical protein
MRTPPPAMRPRVMWIPLVLVGAFLYWTTALGLGGLSLTFLGDSEEDDLALEAPQPADESAATGEPIVVHLESWADAHATAGASGTETDDGTASLPATDDSPSDDDSNGPGQTSY